MYFIGFSMGIAAVAAILYGLFLDDWGIVFAGFIFMIAGVSLCLWAIRRKDKEGDW